MIQVTVPPGVRAGQVFPVRIPSGEQIDVTCPPNCPPGTMIQFQAAATKARTESEIESVFRSLVRTPTIMSLASYHPMPTTPTPAPSPALPLPQLTSRHPLLGHTPHGVAAQTAACCARVSPLPLSSLLSTPFLPSVLAFAASPRQRARNSRARAHAFDRALGVHPGARVRRAGCLPVQQVTRLLNIRHSHRAVAALSAPAHLLPPHPPPPPPASLSSSVSSHPGVAELAVDGRAGGGRHRAGHNAHEAGAVPLRADARGVPTAPAARAPATSSAAPAASQRCFRRHRRCSRHHQHCFRCGVGATGTARAASACARHCSCSRGTAPTVPTRTAPRARAVLALRAGRVIAAC